MVLALRGRGVARSVYFRVLAVIALSDQKKAPLDFQRRLFSFWCGTGEA
jgi:hypothetical protein